MGFQRRVGEAVPIPNHFSALGPDPIPGSLEPPSPDEAPRLEESSLSKKHPASGNS